MKHLPCFFPVAVALLSLSLSTHAESSAVWYRVGPDLPHAPKNLSVSEDRLSIEHSDVSHDVYASSLRVWHPARVQESLPWGYGRTQTVTTWLFGRYTLSQDEQYTIGMQGGSQRTLIVLNDSAAAEPRVLYNGSVNPVTWAGGGAVRSVTSDGSEVTVSIGTTVQIQTHSFALSSPGWPVPGISLNLETDGVSVSAQWEEEANATVVTVNRIDTGRTTTRFEGWRAIDLEVFAGDLLLLLEPDEPDGGPSRIFAQRLDGREEPSYSPHLGWHSTYREPDSPYRFHQSESLGWLVASDDWDAFAWSYLFENWMWLGDSDPQPSVYLLTGYGHWAALDARPVILTPHEREWTQSYRDWSAEYPIEDEASSFLWHPQLGWCYALEEKPTERMSYLWSYGRRNWIQIERGSSAYWQGFWHSWRQLSDGQWSDWEELVTDS